MLVTVNSIHYISIQEMSLVRRQVLTVLNIPNSGLVMKKIVFICTGFVQNILLCDHFAN